MDSRERIIGAVIAIVERDGFAAVNISSVAAVAGVTRPTIYATFETRENMVSQAIESVAVEALNGILASIESIHGAADYIVEFTVCARRELHARPAFTAPMRSEPGNPMLDEGMSGRAELVARALLEPVRDRDPLLKDDRLFGDLVDAVLAYAFYVLILDARRARSDADVRRVMRALVGGFLGGAEQSR